AQVFARPSTIGSPRPTMPALVWTFRNSQRGRTRKVSSFVILSGSLRATGAPLPALSSAAPAWARAAPPRPANRLPIAARRLKVPDERGVMAYLLNGAHRCTISVVDSRSESTTLAKLPGPLWPGAKGLAPVFRALLAAGPEI